jgi:Fe-S-cluster containining protein
VSKKSRDRELHAKLDAIYARLPTIDCRGLCAISCGPILLTKPEADRMKAAHPERRPLRTVPIACTYLTKHKRCSVYAVRPLICRVWGLVKRMSCMHGCVPDRWLTDHEFVDLAAEIEAFAGPLWISSADGLQPFGKSFSELRQAIHQAGAIPPELADVYATQTRGLRALHGGRIIGVHPTDNAEWIDIDEKAKS